MIEDAAKLLESIENIQAPDSTRVKGCEDTSSAST
jgi:hypothetical protein